MMDDMNQELANLSPEQRQLLELMLRQSEEQVSTSQNTIGQQRAVGTAPLSFAQQRLWFLEQLAPGSPVYNLPLAMRVDGKLDVKALAQSLNEVVARHEVLRTTFTAEEGEPKQVIAPTLIIHLPIMDVPATSAAEQSTRVQQLALEEAKQPFNLERGPLLRARLLRLSTYEHILLLTMHHSASDGWSISLLMREMAVLYHAFSAGQPSPLPALPMQYADYAIWQRKWLTGEVLARQLEYWKRQFSGDLPVLDLPTDRPRPPLQTAQGTITKFQIAKDLTDQLKTISQQHAATLFMVLLAAFQTLLHRYTGQHDFVVGTPIANRNRAETESLIGFFVNMLALRVDLSGNPTFSQLLQRVRKVALDAYAHQDLPFERLVDDLQLKRDMSRPPLFQVALVLQNMPMPTIDVAGLKLTWMEMADSGTAKFDITMTLTETADGLRGALEYCTDLFDAPTVDRLLGHYQTLLAGVVANPQQPLSELPLLTGEERHQFLVEWNATKAEYPQEKSIYQLFEIQVEKTPEAVAVVWGDQQLTYAQLNTKANQLAHYLRKRGVGPNVLVGICVERSLEMIVGLLGILKAGGAYVPLDPSYPPDRLKFMLEDANVSVLLTQERILALLPIYTGHLVSLDKDWPAIKLESEENPTSEVTANHLLYVIYTSGSTGKPKGAGVYQHSFVNLLTWFIKDFNLTSADCVLLMSSLSFDLTQKNLYAPLIVGGRLHLPVSERYDANEFVRTVCDKGITWLNCTPSAFYPLLDYAEESLRMKKTLRFVFLGGEPISLVKLSNWLNAGSQLTEIVNTYGPTECTDISAFHRVSDAREALESGVPIGKPISNVRVYVLDQNLQLVPVGVAGELYIAGDGLGLGYINNLGLTAEKFVPNPFGTKPGERLYRTGDLTRWLPGGNIEFLGRIDHQVKIRGFRIELAEIETVLGQHAGVQRCVVLAREDVAGNSPAGIGKQLVAYIAPQPQQVPTMGELRSFIKDKLPEYMVPAMFVMLDALPLSPNGKVDRKALPAPDMTRGETGYIAPRSELEKIISQAWMEVLRLDKVGIHDNFFDLGGHSLLLTQIHHRLREQLSFDLQMLTLFQYPTISSLAAYLNAAEPEKTVALSGALHAQLRRDLMKQPEDGIAVIALAGRFPDAADTDAFWQNLCMGKESISFFSDAELRAAGVDDELLSQPNYVKAGVVLENIEAFDPFFFGYNPREAAMMDPQQRIFLETTWQALERAGYDSERYTGRIGVYASVSVNTYLLNNLMSSPALLQSVGGFQTMLGNDKDFLSTRVSYKLNLKGPSFNVQTACSSSLVAVHLACQSLLRGESDMALAGGVSINANPKTGYLYQEGTILSPDGHCRAFDAQAKGTVGGNGVGVVVLKRLQDAITDGDTICAVIKGSAINNDGSLKVGYTAPSVDGQADVIAEAQAMAGVEPETISYIETHGTGTTLGDPIEIAALTKAFGPSDVGFCAIGSVKSNIGHLDAAAGVTGLIKTVLMLQHQNIPPSLHFTSPNPAIDFEHSPFRVNTTLTAWPAGPTPRRAGVSSFGIGGTNAHAVLEESPLPEPSSPSRPWQLLVLSAKTDAALEKATTNLAAYLKTHPEQNLADTAYTLQVGRRIFDKRRAILCRDQTDAISALESLTPQRVFTRTYEQKEPAIAFMFTGQGAQYVNMGRELYALEPVFRQQLDDCCELLQPHLGLDLRSVLYPANPETSPDPLNQTWLTQPALFVIEYALAHLWMSWGIQPKVLIGHSIGEYVAACLSGVFCLEDALSLVAARGRLMQSLPGGAMLAVPLAEAEVQSLLNDTLSLAAINGPTMCVVSGSAEAVARLESQLKEKGIEGRHLHTSHAFHSAMMEPMLALFSAEVQRVKRNPPTIPFISNLTGEWITASEATDPDYWVRHLRHTVRFGAGLAQLLQDPTLLLLEVGPGRTLSSLALAHPARTVEQTILPSLRHAHDTESDSAFLLTTLAKLWLAGVSISWAAFYRNERRYRVALPTYPFERQRCWIEPSKDKAQPPTDQIYKKKNVADWLYTPSWLPSPLRSKEMAQMPKHCLIFLDESSLGQALVERLKQKSVKVSTVQTGAGWQQIEDGQYVLAPDCPEHYEQLFSALVIAEKTPDTILHLWSLTPIDKQAAGPEYFAQAQTLGFSSLVYLTQALNKQNIHQEIQIDVLSDGIGAFNGPIQPEKATILGPCRVIPQERPAITCRYVDIILPREGTRQETRLVNQLLAQVFDGPSNGTFAWRDEQRWEQCFEPLSMPKQTSEHGLLRENGVYLITGGLGSVGLILAEYLAKQVKAKLVLTGRSVFPPREEWEPYRSAPDEQDAICEKIRRIQGIEALGAEVLVLNADVADPVAMQSVIGEMEHRWGQINGVFHLAGLVNDVHSVQELTAAQSDAHFQSKVHGVLVLEQVLQGHELDFCLLYSSLASVLGGLGYTAYSAANNFMDASARKHNQQGSICWISVNWDAWQVDLAQLTGSAFKSPLADLAMTPEESMKALWHILCSQQYGDGDGGQIVVSTANLQARINRWIKLESIKNETRAGAEVTTLHARPALLSTYAAPRNQAEEMLVAIWQQLLGIEQIGIYDNFFELGGHSLLATQVASRVRSSFQRDLPIEKLFEMQTIAQLAEYLILSQDQPIASAITSLMNEEDTEETRI